MKKNVFLVLLLLSLFFINISNCFAKVVGAYDDLQTLNPLNIGINDVPLLTPESYQQLVVPQKYIGSAIAFEPQVTVIKDFHNFKVWNQKQSSGILANEAISPKCRTVLLSCFYEMTIAAHTSPTLVQAVSPNCRDVLLGVVYENEV